jgi:hypothetical protein
MTLVYYLEWLPKKSKSYQIPSHMFAPITSEITLSTGTILQEIATGQLFEVGIRVKEVWGTDTWEITEINPDNFDKIVMALTRQELAMKYLAEVAD